MRLTKKELMSAINQPMCFGSRLVGKKMFAQIIKELCEYKTIEEEHNIKSVDDLDKKLTALEIIKETFDFSVELGSCPDGTITYKLNVWCKGTPVVCRNISKEKYDLLKEVLL